MSSLAKFRLLITLVLTLVIAPGFQQLAAQDYEPQTPIGKMFQSMNPQNWKMPEMKMPKMRMPKMRMPSFGNIMPGKAEKDRIVKRKDSLVTEVKQTAHRSWTKTKQTLNPKRLIPAAFLADDNDRQSPVRQSSGGTLDGFFGNIMSPPEPFGDEESKSNSTVTDFLRQNKPMR